MSEMIKRIARIVEEMVQVSYDGEIINAEEVARAVIEAMRPVLEAARTDLIWWDENHGCCGGASDETLALIAEALNDQPTIRQRDAALKGAQKDEAT